MTSLLLLKQLLRYNRLAQSSATIIPRTLVLVSPLILIKVVNMGAFIVSLALLTLISIFLQASILKPSFLPNLKRQNYYDKNFRKRAIKPRPLLLVSIPMLTSLSNANGK